MKLPAKRATATKCAALPASLLAMAIYCTSPTSSLLAQSTVESVLATAAIEQSETGFNLDWQGAAGHTYFIQYSTDLVNWHFMPVIESGNDAPLGYGFGAVEDGVFLRLKYTNESIGDMLTGDLDGDGVSNWDEVREGGNGSDPFLYSTNGDGVSDYHSDFDSDGLANGWELSHYGSTNVISIANQYDDDDSDGLTALEESELGTNPNSEDTDGDSVNDLEDGWPLCAELAPARLPAPQHLIIPIKQGDASSSYYTSEINNNGHALINSQITGSANATHYYDGSETTELSPAGGKFEALNETNYFLQKSWKKDEYYPGLYHAGIKQTDLYSPEAELTAWSGYIYNNSLVTYYGVNTVLSDGSMFGQASRGHDYLWEEGSFKWTDTGDPEPLNETLVSFSEILHLNEGQAEVWTYTANVPLDKGEDNSGFENYYSGNLRGGYLDNMSGVNSQDIILSERNIVGSDFWVTDSFDTILTGGTSTIDLGYLVDGAFTALKEDLEQDEYFFLKSYETHISNNNTVIMTYYDDASDTTETTLWIDTKAGIQNDQAVDANPSFQELNWLPAMGDAPPANLNAQMQGFEPDGDRIWQNGQWVQLYTSDNWSNLKIKDINDKGVYAAQATNADGEKSAIVGIPVEVLSRDRMLSGTVYVPDYWDDRIELEFTNKDSGENLGTYGNLLSQSQGAYLYDSDQDLFSDGELSQYDGGSLDTRILTEDVIFCKREGEENVIEFYTVFEALGNVEIRVMLDGKYVDSIEHTLAYDETFSMVIDYINDSVIYSPIEHGGSNFASAIGTANTNLATAAAINVNIGNNIHPLAKKALVSIYNGMGVWLGSQADAERLIVGLVEGVKQGVVDDWEMLKLLGKLGGTAVMVIADNVPDLLVKEVQRWDEEPYKRASDIFRIHNRLVKDVLLDPLAALSDNFSSREKYKKFSWGIFKKAKAGAQLSWKLSQNMTDVILDSLADWFEDFGQRMYEGGEATLFSSVAFGPVDPWRAQLREFYYTFGYSFGYIAEQLLLGKGIGAVSKGMAKTGGKIALSAIPHLKRFSTRMLPFVTKSWSSKTISTADKTIWRDILRGAQRETLDDQLKVGTQLNSDNLKPVAESLDEAVERSLAALNGKVIREEIDALPRLAGVAARKAVLSRLGMLSKLMGDKLDDVAAMNFIKIYERKLLLDPALGDDYFEAFVKAFHSKGASSAFNLDDIDDVAKGYLELFLKEPDPGSPWKLSTLGGGEPRNHFARGNLIELDAAKRGKYKDHEYLDELSDSGPTEAVDFRRVTSEGTEYVQETSTLSQTDATLGNLRTKLERTVQHAADNGGNKAVLDIHILEGRAHNYQSLLDYADELSDELEDIAVEVVLTPKKFAGWLVE